MQNFDTQITIRGIDKFTPVTKKIEKNLSNLTISSQKIASKFRDVTSAASALGHQLKIVGYAVAGIVTSGSLLIYKYSEHAEALELLSQRTGVATEQLQKLGYAASLSGVDADAMSTSLKFLNRNIGLAGTTAESDAANAFHAMGINVRDASGQLKSADKVLFELADTFSKSANGSQKVLTAMTLLGRSGTDLIPLLNEGSAAIAKMGGEFEKVGHVLTDNEIKKAKEFNDDIKKLSVAFRGVSDIVAGALVPIFDPLVTKITDFVAQNKELIKTKTIEYVQDLANGIQTVWTKLTIAGAAIKQAVNYFGGFGNVVKGIIGLKIASIATDVFSLARAVVSLGTALVSSPMGVFALTITSVAYAVYEINKAFPELGKTVVGTTKIMLDKIKAFFDYLIGQWTKVEGVYNKITGKKTYTMDEYNKLVKPKNDVKLATTGTAYDALVNPKKAASVAPRVLQQQPANDELSFGAIDKPVKNVQPVQNTANVAKGGFDGFLQGLQNAINQTKQQMSLDIKLDTQNKVTAVSADSSDIDVAIAAGSMWGY